MNYRLWTFTFWQLWLTVLPILFDLEMSNQELINAGMKTMDETDQAIERSKQVKHHFSNILKIIR